MKSISWQKIGLRKNPFKIVPNKEKESLVWAGFSKNKKKFEKILSESIKSEESKVILIISRYGGGKTHSSFYFSNPNNLPDEVRTLPKPFQIIVKTPQEGSKASWELYKTIIDQIKWRRIEGAVTSLRTTFNSNKKSLRLLEEWTNSEDLGRLLWLMGEEDPDMVFKAEQALFGQSTSSIMNTLRIRREISSNNDMANVLSGIIKLISRYKDKEVFENNRRRIIIWIDELESLIFYTSKQYRPFSQFLRELFDITSTDLTLFLNFSFSEPSEFQNIEIVLGQALIDRISQQIIFDEASLEESKKYLLELLKFYRIEGFDKNEFYPFNNEEAVDLLLERASTITEKPRTPRTINKWCLNAISEALNRGILYEKQIDTELINSLKFMDD